MEKLRTQRYAESLERAIQNNYRYLKGIMDDFQEKCQVVASVETAPPRVVVEIPQTYHEIQHRLKEITAIQQLLRAKYFIYARKDPGRDKDIADLAMTAKTAYSKFEHTLKPAEGGEVREEVKPPKAGLNGGPFLWFRDKENLVKFLRNWRILDELDYEVSPSRVEEKRVVSTDRPRSLTLFIFKGDGPFIDDLQSRLLLREHDIVERYDQDELRGILTHLREVEPGEVEKIFERFKAVKGYSKLKCLLLPIRSHKDLEKDLVALKNQVFTEMQEGQVKTLVI
jgi:hypothetical protein